jgi:hypothetical protein
MIEAKPITVGVYNRTGIANIREIVGNINQSIILIQNGGDDQIADILKDIGEAVITDPSMEQHARQTAIEILRMLAWEASVPPAERRLGMAKAALTFMPMYLSPHVLNYFGAHVENLRKFFKISA